MFESVIEGKVVVITGASAGIGEATARLLSARGAKLVLAARKPDALHALAKELHALAVPADVSKRAEVEALMARALDAHGVVDVLISNAGVGPISRLEQRRVDDWEAMVDINFKSVMYGIAAALPVFQRQQRGHFVNVISTAGLKIVPMQALYAATKNAVRTLTEGLRQECGPNIRVTGISPGMVRTHFAAQATNDPALLQRVKDIGLPPEAVARAIVFAIEQPPEVDVNDIVIRPTAQK